MIQRSNWSNSAVGKKLGVSYLGERNDGSGIDEANILSRQMLIFCLRSSLLLFGDFASARNGGARATPMSSVVSFFGGESSGSYFGYILEYNPFVLFAYLHF